MQIIAHFGDNVNKMEDTALKMAYVRFRPALGPTQPPTQLDARSLPAIKWPGLGVDHPLPTSTEVKEGVGL